MTILLVFAIAVCVLIGIILNERNICEYCGRMMWWKGINHWYCPHCKSHVIYSN